jgi:UV DNA damage repair endonuclease
VDDDHRDNDHRLALLQMGCRGSDAVLRLGIDCDRAATEHHLDELESMIRLGLCCIFRDQPIRFRTTTAAAISRMKRADGLVKLSGLCMANAEALLASLHSCADNGIGCFRMGPAVRIVSDSIDQRANPIPPNGHSW